MLLLCNVAVDLSCTNCCLTSMWSCYVLLLCDVTVGLECCIMQNVCVNVIVRLFLCVMKGFFSRPLNST